MYVTKEAIEEVRRANCLIDVVRGRGIELEPRGRDYVGPCPFHQDDALSLIIRPDERRWMCVGACATGGRTSGGDVVAFVVKKEGVSFTEALRRLGYREPKALVIQAVARQVRGGDERLMRRVVEHYHRTFKESPVAQDYLRSSGLTNPEMLGAFQAGYVDGSLPRMTNAGIRERLRVLGLISPRGREVFEGFIVLPLTNPESGPVGFHGRHVTTGMDRYVGAGGGAIFHWQAMKGSAEVILAASIFDVLALYQVGIRNVFAIPAAADLAPDHLKLLSRFRVRSVLICLEDGPAKAALTRAMAAKLHKLGIDAADACLPGGGSPNALLLALGPDKAAHLFRQHFSEARGRMIGATTGSEETWRPESPSQPNGSAVSERDAPRPDPAVPTAAPTVSMPEVTRAEGGGFVVRFPARSYRVRGLKEDNLHQLRVNVRVDGNERMYVETLDLYGQRSRSGWIREAARELGAPEEELIAELHALIEKLEGRNTSPDPVWF